MNTCQYCIAMDTHTPKGKFNSIFNRTPEWTQSLTYQNSTYKEFLRVYFLKTKRTQCLCLFINSEYFTSVNKSFLFIQKIFLEKCHDPLKCISLVPFSKWLISNNKVLFLLPCWVSCFLIYSESRESSALQTARQFLEKVFIRILPPM